MKRITLSIVLCGVLSFTIAAQQNPMPVKASGLPSETPVVVPANLVTCQGILANYTNSAPDAGGGVTSQDFEETYDIYDNMSADDFEAPGSGESTICDVSITGTLGGAGFSADPDSQIVLRVFEDDGGLPGAELYMESFPGTVDANNDGSFVLELTGGPSLMGGTTYWLSVQAKLNNDLAGQWFWSTAEDGNGEIYAWQNPGDGFGNGCVEWSPHTNCALPGIADLLMNISFNEALGTNTNSLETAISIYPNPAKNQFTLRSDVSLEKLTIYDIRGRMMRNIDLSEMANDKTIDISSLLPGVYMVQITGQKGTVVKNLVKQ